MMGSEGYLINQFLAARTNDRTDEWGGIGVGADAVPGRDRAADPRARRRRFPIIYRISLLDLVEGGQTWDEVVELAQRLEQAGVTAFNTGIGWHEARVPTIITQVPRGVWAPWTARLREVVDVPVFASNRINTPELAEQLLADGDGRPGVDGAPVPRRPRLRPQGRRGARRRDQHLHRLQPGLPRPHLRQPDRVLPGQPARLPRDLAGARPDPARARRSRSSAPGRPGSSTAVAAAERGFPVTLFEAAPELGGQFRLAMAVPGKEDFAETLRYYTRRLEVLGVDVRLSTRATVADLAGFDEVVVATGVEPRIPDLPGIDHPSVVSYADVLSGAVVPGRRVAVIGAGGIGVDVSPLADPRPGRHRRGLAGALGRRRPGGPPRRADRAQAADAGARGDPGAAQDHADRPAPRQDLRLGAPGGAPAVRGHPGQRRDVRPDRRRRPPRHRRRRRRR